MIPAKRSNGEVHQMFPVTKSKANWSENMLTTAISSSFLGEWTSAPSFGYL